MNIMNLSTLKRFSRLPLVRAAGVVSILAGTSGCVVAVRPAPAPVVYEQPVGAPSEVVVTSDPPAPLYETIGVAPGPGFIWVGGYYHWNGGGWVWRGGRWARPPHPGAAWVRARYEWRGGRRVYIAGFWR
jgi:hypothetical protein